MSGNNKRTSTVIVEGGRRKEWRNRLVNVPVERASTILFDSVAELESERARAWDLSLRAAGHRDPLGAVGSVDRARTRRGRNRAFRPDRRLSRRPCLLCFRPATSCWSPTASTARPASSATPSSSATESATRYYDPLVGADIAGLIGDKTRAILLESPGSLTMEVQDVPGDLRRRTRARNRHPARQYLGDAPALPGDRRRRRPLASSPQPNMSAAMPT